MRQKRESHRGLLKKTGMNGTGAAKREYRKFLGPAACVLGSVLLYLMLGAMNPDTGPVSADGRIERGAYGSRRAEYEVLVSGLKEEAVPMTVSVGAQVYSKEAAGELFAELMETMPERIRGGNASLMEVQKSLKLPSKLPEYGVRLRWFSSDGALMDGSGKILEEVEKPRDALLTLELQTDTSEGLYRENYQIPIRLIPPDRTPAERLLADFEKALTEADRAQHETGELKLPEEFEGHRIGYRSRTGSGYEAVLLFGALLAVLMLARERSADEEKRKKREKELLLDYSDLLSKLTVLIAAGLTVRNAWERMVHDYEEAKRSGRQKERAAYEEMSYTCLQMRSGVPESEAFREFGRRCRLQPYMKLSSLLEQDRRSGTRNLREIFQTEMTDALEARKNLARRLGEEAGTRLLAPLLIMLAIVMIMIMVPAMMSMG